MRVLMLNGSLNHNGCTYTALQLMADKLQLENIYTEIIWGGDKALQDCAFCYACTKLGKCIYDDDIVNEFIEKSKISDGFVLGIPMMHTHPSGRIISILDRVFLAGGKYLSHKPMSIVIITQNKNVKSVLPMLNEYFTMNKMPIIFSENQNILYARTPKEIYTNSKSMQCISSLSQDIIQNIKQQ